jgi:hypothetical protein
MTSILVPCASGESPSQEVVTRRAWRQDGRFTPAQSDPIATDAPSGGGFVHEKWWIEETGERATAAPEY